MTMPTPAEAFRVGVPITGRNSSSSAAPSSSSGTGGLAGLAAVLLAPGRFAPGGCRSSIRGRDWPCVQVPSMVLPLASSWPTKVPETAGTSNRKVSPCRLTLVQGIGVAPWSRL